MVNTYGNVARASPPNRGFGLVELWMIGAQVPIFFAMMVYGYILFHMKKELPHAATCSLDKSIEKDDNFRIANRKVKVSSEFLRDRKKENCCSSMKSKKIDKIAGMVSISGFIFYNMVYWTYVAYISK